MYWKWLNHVQIRSVCADVNLMLQINKYDGWLCSVRRRSTRGQIMSKLADIGTNKGSRLYQIKLDPENKVVGAMIRAVIM